jgi:hypothetical protein
VRRVAHKTVEPVIFPKTRVGLPQETRAAISCFYSLIAVDAEVWRVSAVKNRAEVLYKNTTGYILPRLNVSSVKQNLVDQSGGTVPHENLPVGAS